MLKSERRRLLVWLLVTLIAILGLAVLPYLAHAEDADELRVSLPASQAADLLLKAEQLATATQALAARDEEITALRRKATLLEEVLALEERKQAKQAELTTLALDERDFWKGRLEAVENASKSTTRWAGVRRCAYAGAATGALAAPITGGISLLVGPLGGGLLALLSGDCPF